MSTLLFRAFLSFRKHSAIFHDIQSPEGGTMSLSLPPPIALYVQLENAGETEKLSACFAPYAIVHDESRTYEGLAAITAWKAETKRNYHHTITPLNVAYEQGKIVKNTQPT